MTAIETVMMMCLCYEAGDSELAYLAYQCYLADADNERAFLARVIRFEKLMKEAGIKL